MILDEDSGGISLENAADFIRCGARNFFDYEQQYGLEWVTRQVAKYIEIVANAKADAPPLP